jgi:CRP-like cAMP-binding protein
MITAAAIFTALFHVSNLMAFFAFLLRDQLQLRLLMAVSLFLQALYYFALPGGPFIDPLFWKVASFLANLAMIILVFGGSIDFGIPEDLRGLFNKISVLSPGQFRKLTKHTSRVTTTSQAILIEGEKPQHLYYLLKGEAQLSKAGLTRKLQAGQFLGEIAFLNSSRASATVTLKQGAECIAWDADGLKTLMRDDKAIDIAMRGIFNHDLAAKVASSIPIERQSAS